MARKFTVTLTSGTDQGPYNIYYDTVSVGTLADLFGTSNKAENLTLSQVQSGVVIEVPDNANSIIFFNTNPDVATDCPTNQEIFTLTTQATQTPIPTYTPVPTETPTPTPTDEVTCQCYEFINTTQGNISYTYTDCSGTSVEAVSDKEPWTFYVCAQSIDNVTNTKLTYSLYGSCTEGVCDNMPTPIPTYTPVPTETPTPTPTPSPTADNVQIRNLKFAHCNTVETSPVSEEVGTQAAGGPSEPPIYLTTDEYGSTPTIGDTVYVRLDGETNNKCYEYIGIETGANVSLTIINTSCVCPSLEPSPTPTSTPTPTPTNVAELCVDVEFNGKSETSGSNVTYEDCDGITHTLSIPGGDSVTAPTCVRNNSWTYSNPSNMDPETLLPGDCNGSNGSEVTPTPTATSGKGDVGGPIGANEYYLSAGRSVSNDFCSAPGYTATRAITSSATSIGNMLNTTVYDDGDPIVGNPLLFYFVSESQGENSNETVGNPQYINISEQGVVTDVGQMCGSSGDGNSSYSEPINPTSTPTE